MPANTSYHLKGELLGACSCDWGCPCNFEAPPTTGFCEGMYVWHIREGTIGAVIVSGLTIAWGAHSPAAVHLGSLTGVWVFDQRATPLQREALEDLVTRNPDAVPFAIFASLTTTLLGVHLAPFDLALDGRRSRLQVPGFIDLVLVPMTNPVTGEEEPATLLKPKGFTSQRQELCASTVFKLSAGGLRFDHSGKYAEYSEFEYRG